MDIEIAITKRIQALSNIHSDLCDNNSMDSSLVQKIKNPLAALAVLGGFKEIVRLGGRVQVLAADADTITYGTVVSFERGRKDVKVVFDYETEITTVELSQLSPVGEHSLINLPFCVKPKILDPLLLFLKEALPEIVTLEVDGDESERLRAQLSVYGVRTLCELLANKEMAEILSN